MQNMQKIRSCWTESAVKKARLRKAQFTKDFCKHAKSPAEETDSNLYARTCHLDLYMYYLFATHNTTTITNGYKKMQEEMARRPKGNSVKLMLITIGLLNCNFS